MAASCGITSRAAIPCCPALVRSCRQSGGRSPQEKHDRASFHAFTVEHGLGSFLCRVENTTIPANIHLALPRSQDATKRIRPLPAVIDHQPSLRVLEPESEFGLNRCRLATTPVESRYLIDIAPTADVAGERFWPPPCLSFHLQLGRPGRQNRKRPANCHQLPPFAQSKSPRINHSQSRTKGHDRDRDPRCQDRYKEVPLPRVAPFPPRPSPDLHAASRTLSSNSGGPCCANLRADSSAPLRAALPCNSSIALPLKMASKVRAFSLSPFARLRLQRR